MFDFIDNFCEVNNDEIDRVNYTKKNPPSVTSIYN